MITDEIRASAIENNDLFRETPRFKNKHLRFSLPIPTSVNALYITSKYGKKSLTRDALTYTRIAQAKLRLYMEEQKWTLREGAEWLYVDMTYYFPDRRVRDASNCLKLLLDVMQGIVYKNDFYVMPRIQGVEYDKENPRVEIRISMQSESERNKAKLLS